MLGCLVRLYGNDTHTLIHHPLPTNHNDDDRPPHPDTINQQLIVTSTTTHTADGFPDLAPPIAAPEVMALLRRTQKQQQQEQGVVLVDVRTEGVSK